MKHLETPLIILCCVAAFGLAEWFEVLERADCRESGGIWNEGKGCEPNVCLERGK